MTTIHTLNRALREYTTYVYETLDSGDEEGEWTFDDWHQAWSECESDIHDGFIGRIEDPQELVEEYGVWEALQVYDTHYKMSYLMDQDKDVFYENLLFAIMDKDEDDERVPHYQGFLVYSRKKKEEKGKEGEQ